MSGMLLKALRHIYRATSGKAPLPRPDCIMATEVAAGCIYAQLDSNKPSMLARFGSTELACLGNYLAVKRKQRSWLGYIQGTAHPWWWNSTVIQQMNTWSGFFPTDIASIERFCELMLQDIPLVDVLGSWHPDEILFAAELASVSKVDLELLNPFFSEMPWTRALSGKKILVIHPFTDTIESQYKKRTLIFDNDLLPAFELKTIKAVQSLADTPTGFVSWFDALDHMKNEMDRIDYDICLIGCGAYGFPLAAHAKRMGKKGFHIGGSLQLLFGIRGKRWENPNYSPDYNFSFLMNEHWVRPGENERPTNANKVEAACYW